YCGAAYGATAYCGVAGCATAGGVRYSVHSMPLHHRWPPGTSGSGYHPAGTWGVVASLMAQSVEDDAEPGRPARKDPRLTGGSVCARYWDRTSDLFRVREARYRC